MKRKTRFRPRKLDDFAEALASSIPVIAIIIAVWFFMALIGITIRNHKRKEAYFEARTHNLLWVQIDQPEKSPVKPEAKLAADLRSYIDARQAAAKSEPLKDGKKNGSDPYILKLEFTYRTARYEGLATRTFCHVFGNTSNMEDFTGTSVSFENEVQRYLKEGKPAIVPEVPPYQRGIWHTSLLYTKYPLYIAAAWLLLLFAVTLGYNWAACILAYPVAAWSWASLRYFRSNAKEVRQLERSIRKLGHYRKVLAKRGLTSLVTDTDFAIRELQDTVERLRKEPDFNSVLYEQTRNQALEAEVNAVLQGARQDIQDVDMTLRGQKEVVTKTKV